MVTPTPGGRYRWRMSDRHTHITGFLYDGEPEIAEFVAAARATGFFSHVLPVGRESPGGETRAVVFFSKDAAGFEDEMRMPQIAERLSGILAYDTAIVSAWESDPGRERERVWPVRGRPTVS